jgi:hypothetical protein
MSFVAAGKLASWDVMTSAHRGLGFLLADYTNHDTGLCCPSIETLARRAKMTERGVQKALQGMEDAGIIKRHFRHVDGRQTTSQYEILSPPPRNQSSGRPELEFTPEGELQFAPEGELEFTHNQEVVTRKKEQGETLASSPVRPPRKSSTTHGSRLALAELPDTWRDYCRDKRPDLRPDETWEDFRDYWASQPGQKGVKADWLATWRRWVRNQKPGTNPPTKPKPKHPDDWTPVSRYTREEIEAAARGEI